MHYTAISTCVRIVVNSGRRDPVKGADAEPRPCLLMRGFFLVRLFHRIEYRAGTLDVKLHFKDLVQQPPDIGARFFGLRSKPLDQLRRCTNSLRGLHQRVFDFSERFCVNDHLSSSLKTRAKDRHRHLVLVAVYRETSLGAIGID